MAAQLGDPARTNGGGFGRGAQTGGWRPTRWAGGGARRAHARRGHAGRPKADGPDPRWTTQRAPGTLAFLARYGARRGRPRPVTWAAHNHYDRRSEVPGTFPVTGPDPQPKPALPGGPLRLNGYTLGGVGGTGVHGCFPVLASGGML